jgi:hypothetical protein
MLLSALLTRALPREWSPENIGGEWQGGGSGKVRDRYIGHNTEDMLINTLAAIKATAEG